MITDPDSKADVVVQTPEKVLDHQRDILAPFYTIRIARCVQQPTYTEDWKQDEHSDHFIRMLVSHTVTEILTSWPFDIP